MMDPQPASSAILQRGDRFLLIRRINPPSADLFAFPGGRAEPGETPAETAVREFFEETGIAVTDPQLFATYDLKTQGEDGQVLSHFHLSVFLVKADETVQAVAADDAAEAGWYTAEEIGMLPVPPSVRECAQRLAVRPANG